MDTQTLTATIRAVVNTDVLISGLLSGIGHAGEIVDRWLAGEFTLLTSDQILSECERILAHPTLQQDLRLDNLPKEDLMALLRDRSEITEVPRSGSPVMVANPFDEVVLASAVAGHADHLVTEEENLLALREYEGVVIVSPERFVQLLIHYQGRLL
ncbi:MAG: putative toxin-antitoxin system toxin component, PIN family [Anaerolineae bacterium]